MLARLRFSGRFLFLLGLGDLTVERETARDVGRVSMERSESCRRRDVFLLAMALEDIVEVPAGRNGFLACAAELVPVDNLARSTGVMGLNCDCVRGTTSVRDGGRAGLALLGEFPGFKTGSDRLSRKS